MALLWPDLLPSQDKSLQKFLFFQATVLLPFLFPPSSGKLTAPQHPSLPCLLLCSFLVQVGEICMTPSCELFAFAWQPWHTGQSRDSVLAGEQHCCPASLLGLSWRLKTSEVVCLMPGHQPGIWVALFLFPPLLLTCLVVLSGGFCPQRGASVSPALQLLILLLSCCWGH